MNLRAAMDSNSISRIFRRRFLIPVRLDLRRAICSLYSHTGMKLAALDRLWNHPPPKRTDCHRNKSHVAAADLPQRSRDTWRFSLLVFFGRLMRPFGVEFLDERNS